jgi:hypothetical protein
MKDRNKAGWLGLIALVGLFAPFLNAANAAIETKTLIEPTVKVAEPPKGVFLISTAKKLEKYENSHSLTDGELVDLLKAVGFKNNALRSACAVAKAESNGRPLAFNPNKKTGDSSYGMFQINMIGELGPDRRSKFELDSNAELFNPVINAQVAHYMTKGGKDWSSWSSVNGARYQEWYNKYPCKQDRD